MEVDDRLVADERDLLADDRVDDVAHRCGRPPEHGEVAPYGEDLSRRSTRAVVAEDHLFDGVEPLVERVGHLEVAVDDHVEQRPEQKPLLRGAVLGALELETPGDLVEVDGGAVVARVPHGHQPARTRDDVDLAAGDRRVDALAVVHGDMEVVAVTHQLGALAGVEDGVEDGGTDPEIGA